MESVCHALLSSCCDDLDLHISTFDFSLLRYLMLTVIFILSISNKLMFSGAFLDWQGMLSK